MLCQDIKKLGHKVNDILGKGYNTVSKVLGNIVRDIIHIWRKL